MCEKLLSFRIGLDLKNVRSEIRAIRVGKSFRINKRTGTFISDSRVHPQYSCSSQKKNLREEWTVFVVPVGLGAAGCFPCPHMKRDSTVRLRWNATVVTNCAENPARQTGKRNAEIGHVLAPQKTRLRGSGGASL